MVRLQSETIDTAELIRRVQTDADGAVALFVGAVRDHNEGRSVTRLEYQAYSEMALPEMEKIESETLERFPVTRVAIVHRTGTLAVGEASVAVAVSSPHRGDAFDACRHAIDTLKKTVPIWKKEFFEGGETWIEGS
ncbi:MAG: molybdenum cofactor biosynthesis protein MoaE [bacterium]|nr:molybdenum cofactor biosynthesis protein MoaE [bacterium]